MKNEIIITPNTYTLSRLGGEVMVTSDSMEDILIVNEIGAFILETIKNNKSIALSYIVDKIKQEYQVDLIDEDVTSFLKDMKESGVISISYM